MKKRPRITKKSCWYAKNGKKKNKDVIKIKMKGVSNSGRRLQITLEGLSLNYKECKSMLLSHLSRQ